MQSQTDFSKIKFFIDQHGCAKNQVDGELICSCLAKLGCWQIFDAEKADVIVVNSCGFIESAKKESLAAVYEARKQNRRAKIILAGCLAERYAEILKNELFEVDAIFGNADISQVTSVVQNLFLQKKKSKNIPVIKSCQKGVSATKRTHFLSYRGSVFVKTTEGCSNHCSFCAIPLIRGELRSRTEKQIVAEIKQLVAKGFYEINLIGQDLAAYGTGECDSVCGEGRTELPRLDKNGKNCGTKKESALCHLLKSISAIDGDFCVRLLYIHPDHFNFDILPVMQKDKRLLPYFDIPFQSGSDKIIRAMNRKGTQQEYIRLVAKIKKALPDAVIRTTFLAGFPGETDVDAKATKDFLKAVKPDWSGCFTYSREEGTVAHDMKERVPQKVAKMREKDLQAVQGEITQAKLFEKVSCSYDILIEEVVNVFDEETGFAIGRAWFEAPEVDGCVVVRFDSKDKNAILAMQAGNVVKVFIDKVNGVDLEGRFVELVKRHPKNNLHFATEQI